MIELSVYPCCGAVSGWPHLATCQGRAATLPQWALDASREWDGDSTPETPAKAPWKPVQRVEGLGRTLAAVNRPAPLYAPYFWSAKP